MSSCTLQIRTDNPIAKLILSELQKQLGSQVSYIRHLLTISSREKEEVSVIDETTGKEVLDDKGEVVKETKDFYLFSNEFLKEFKTELGFDLLDTTEEQSEAAAKFIRDYTNRKHPNIEYQSLLNTNQTEVGQFGYSSIAARVFAKRYAANIIIDYYHKFIQEGSNIEKKLKEVNKKRKAKNKKELNKREYVETLITQGILAEIRNRLIKKLGYSVDDATALIAKKDMIALEKAFEETANITDLNLLATYKETLGNTKAFFDDVYLDSRFVDIRLDKLKEMEEDEAYDATEGQEDTDENGRDESDNTSKDHSIAQLNEKLGDYPTFMQHVDMNMRMFLGSIRILKTAQNKDEDPVFDTDNPLGVPDYMDVEECVRVLYSFGGDCTSVSTMINNLRTISNCLEGYAAFKGVADFMEENMDFAYEFYRTFGKTVMSKLETTLNNGNVESKRSNKNADRVTSLRFEYMNGLRSSIPMIDNEVSKAMAKDISNKIEEYGKALEYLDKVKDDKVEYESAKSKINAAKDEIVAKTAELLRRYFPTIKDTEIAYFSNNEAEGDVITNISNLLSIVESIAKLADSSKNVYNSLLYQKNQAYAHNKKLEKEAAELGVNVDRKKLKEVPNESDFEFLSPELKVQAKLLADTLVKYVLVKIELNSRNVKGNLTSDVINNSMITNIIKTLQSTIGLENFGKYKSQSRQYDLSNIMIEHKEGGTIINYGLFRLDKEGNYIPTEYAKDLISASLFNGASNLDTSASAKYSELSGEDYTATAFCNFFHTEQVEAKDQRLNFANYFMRIPSDAPKNFCIKMPRYDTSQLFVIVDQNAANLYINRALNALSGYVDAAEFTAKEGWDLGSKEISNEEFVDIALGRNDNDIVLEGRKGILGSAAHLRKLKPGSEIRIVLENKVGSKMVVKGRYNIRDNKVVLTGTTFESIVGYIEEETDINLYNAFSKALLEKGKAEGKIKTAINKKHPIFRQMCNAFTQEVQDAAIALNVFFENKKGMIDVVKEKDGTIVPVFKEGFDNTEETARKLFGTYHVKESKGKNQPILTKQGDVYILEGAVFNSDKFTLKRYKENGEIYLENYGERILKEAFDFLYGAANGKYIHTRIVKGSVQVELTKEQQAAVERGIERYIRDAITEAGERVAKHRHAIPEQLLTQENLVEFTLNYNLAHMAFNDLFEGDTKFYGGPQTFLKRAKEVQGSGVPYGIVDYELDLTHFQISDLRSGLDTADFKQKLADGTIRDYNVRLRNGFRAVTVVNTIRTSEECKVGDDNGKEDGVVTKKLMSVLKESGMKEADAKAKARELMSGFANQTVNDAQSYITFNEWIRRVTARGQFQQYKKLIEAVLDETKPLDAKTIEEFIQVQKNFYYDQNYSEDLHVIAPRQIKNAEFVLVPRLVRGTELEQVAELMEEFEIDQLNTAETSKAGKSKVLTLWNEEGVITEDNVADFRNHARSSTEKFSYNYLYTQQETPQHIDAQNKAGIQVMKKIMDNIAPESPLYPLKQKFFSLYSENIKQSYMELMDELDLKYDSEGNLQLNDNGHLENLNFGLFYNMLIKEAARLGVDSNMMDFLTLDENEPSKKINDICYPNTLMPNYMSNVSKKLENIAQSLFNSRITRQKLPGFHAAQITNVGFSARNDKMTYVLDEELAKAEDNKRPLQISKEEFEALSSEEQANYNKAKGEIRASKRLKYHPNGENYIEVMLPASAFGLNRYDPVKKRMKTDEELLEELKIAKVDEFIGYRIPTEGKQSICKMKVVGFIDDALGSTIVLPDDWVSQTGSDFDIDSVYGIVKKSRITKNGRLEAINYIEDNSVSDVTKRLYINYIKERLNHKPESEDLTKEIEKLRKVANENIVEKWRELIEAEGESYKALKTVLPKTIAQVQKIQESYNSLEKKDSNTLAKQYKHVIIYLEKVFEQNKDKFVGKNAHIATAISDMIAANNNLLNYVLNEGKEFAKIFNENKRNLTSAVLDKQVSAVEEVAKENKFPSYEEFLKMSSEVRNGREARNNEIADVMMQVLSSDLSLEENLSRSNFDDLIDAYDKAVSKNDANRRKMRSPYSFWDNADAQEDVMSGAKLKAFSVVRDTFCSICNTVRPSLGQNLAITIEYDTRDGYNYDEIVKAFGAENVSLDDKGIIRVKHNTFGWTNNNLNVAGKILTSYSSQTTAHILDAVKKGAIPNVNDLTFQVYKIFPDVGSDYTTGVAFIMQPGIRKIVEAYNSAKSIFNKKYTDPVNEAITKHCIELLAYDGKYTRTELEKDPIDTLLEKVKVTYNYKFKQLFLDIESKFKISLDSEDLNMLSFNSRMMNDRLKDEGIFDRTNPESHLNSMLYDLHTMLQYNKLSVLGNLIKGYARVCNPDKFGAKQSIFETRQALEDIVELVRGENDKTNKNSLYVARTKIVKTEDNEGNAIEEEVEDNIGFLNSIYGNVTSPEDITKLPIEDSSYKPLMAFLKYATATSVFINETLFLTQNEWFRKGIMDVQNLFSGKRRYRMDERMYTDVQRYVLAHIYKNTTAVRSAATFTIGEGFDFKKNANVTYDLEYARINGYGRSPGIVYVDDNGESVIYSCEDVTKPTQEEIDNFAKLSPAQKVEFIKRRFEDPGIFEYITTALFNNQSIGKIKKNTQSIQYKDNSISIETAYIEFEKAFFNSNPLIALTALDVIKYAMVVEGFKMKRNAVNRIIKNSTLLGMEGVESHNTNIVEEINNSILSLQYSDFETLRNNYIRSHYRSIWQIETHKLDVTKDKTYADMRFMSDGSAYLNFAYNKDLEIAEKYGLVKSHDKKDKSYKFNPYVKFIMRDGKTVLFRVVKVQYTLNTKGKSNEEIAKMMDEKPKYEATLNEDMTVSVPALYLYPLNALDENESAEWSANPSNNLFAKESYYKSVIDNAQNRQQVSPEYLASLAGGRTKTYLANKYTRGKSDTRVTLAKEFDINKPDEEHKVAFGDVKSEVYRHFETERNIAPLILRTNAFKGLITDIGPGNASVQNIFGRDYIIEKVSFARYNNLYIGPEENKRGVIKNDVELPKTMNPQYRRIIEGARSIGKGESVGNVVKIYPKGSTAAHNAATETTPNDVRQSSVTEVGSRSMEIMYRNANINGDQNAYNALQYLSKRDVVNRNSSVAANLADVITISAKYVETTVDEILDTMDGFCQVVDDYVPITDPVVMAIIKDDPAEKQRFLKTILDARALIRNYELLDELQVGSEDPQIKHHIDKIVKAINRLKASTTISEAEKLFGNEFLAKLSKDPLIQQGYLSVLDGYHGTGFFDAWVNDMQETASPLLQIVTKEVMTDIREKEMLGKARAREFRTKIEDIKKRAKERGVEINWENIIDKNGKFVRNYKDNLVDKLDELRNAMKTAQIQSGEWSDDYVKAKFKYDAFKAIFFHQPLIQQYYYSKISYQKAAYSVSPKLYCKYKQLESKKNSILSAMMSSGIEDSYRDEYNQAVYELKELLNPIDAEGQEKSNASAIRNLNEQLKKLAELENQAFITQAKYGFEEQVDKNLEIIRKAEDRDSQGRIRTSAEDLANDETYQRAKNWMNRNAYASLEDELRAELNKAYQKAFSENSKTKGRQFLKRLARQVNAYDEEGEIDPSKFTPEQLKLIKEDNIASMNYRRCNAFSDRALISNAPPHDLVFTTAFYRGMTTAGALNPEYFKKVNEINAILFKYYDSDKKEVETYNMSKEDMKALIKLYTELADLKKKTDVTNGKRVAKFIEENVEFVIDEAKLAAHKQMIQGRDATIRALWSKLCEASMFGDDSTGNHYLYGYAKPKGLDINNPSGRWYDADKTEAFRTINKYTETVPTKYYYKAYYEMSKKSPTEFEKWYNENHVYDPITMKKIPLDMWTRSRVKDDTKGLIHLPKYNQRLKQINTNPTDDPAKIDWTNYEYKENVSLLENYNANHGRTTQFEEFNNNVTRNEFEEEIYDLCQSTVAHCVKTASAKKFFDKGYAPVRAASKEVNAKMIAKEAAKLVGWIETNQGYDAFLPDEQIDYAKDVTPLAPMAQLLKSKDSVKVDYRYPERERGMSDEEYRRVIAEYEQKRNAAEANNREIHKNLLDRNWESVFEDFIEKSAHFNAVQDNKYMLFYAKNMLDKIPTYVANLGFNNYKKLKNNDPNAETQYATAQDNLLKKQYANFLRRLVYDQWKEPNAKFTKAMNLFQSFTSAKFMMLNVTGGIANITVGESNIFGEVFAREYFGMEEWAKGKARWIKAVPHFMSDMYSDDATSLESAIVKFMNVVDYDEITGVVSTPDLTTYLQRARDLAFSPQTMGEHFMQNGAMFSMMESHRLIKRQDGTYTTVNRAEYMREASELALKEVLTEEQKRYWDKFIKHETTDANRFKNYAWRRKDFTTQFVNVYFNKEQKREFIKKRKEFQKSMNEQFEQLPTLMSQLDLKNGMLGFKEGTTMWELYNNDYELGMETNRAYRVLAEFKGRVIAVNKKIHGNYGKLDSAMIESQWWGGVVMQYHKHLYPGIMKRYRRKGYFNEERGTIEKGCYSSIKDFLSLPLQNKEFVETMRAENGMTEDEITATKGMQNLVKNYVEFATHVRLYWNFISEEDRANMKRAMGDILGVLSAVALAIAVRCIYDDDDESLVYNLALYEADRLASESFMYNPIGLINEGKKLWSSPVAIQGAITDTFHTLGWMCQWLIQGDEFDPYYQTGLFAGENKLTVSLKRNIPMYHSVNMLTRLNKSNKYYKLGKNMLSIVPVQDIADFIVGRN